MHKKGSRAAHSRLPFLIFRSRCFDFAFAFRRPPAIIFHNKKHLAKGSLFKSSPHCRKGKSDNTEPHFLQFHRTPLPQYVAYSPTKSAQQNAKPAELCIYAQILGGKLSLMSKNAFSR